MFWTRWAAGILLAAAGLFAQSSGQIAGAVKDPSGAPIPGAAVVLVGQQQGAKAQTSTGAEGNYVFPQLRAETYELTVSSVGFEDYKVTVQLGVGQSRAIEKV